MENCSSATSASTLTRRSISRVTRQRSRDYGRRRSRIVRLRSLCRCCMRVRFRHERRTRSIRRLRRAGEETSMRESLRYALLFSLTIALMSAQTLSQEVDDKHGDDALRQKAYTLLDSLAQQIGSLKSGENRARMGSNIAMSIWPHNEAKARKMFAAVSKEIKGGWEEEDGN